MDFTDEQLARVWLQCAPMGAWNRLDALRKEWGGALNVWRQFTPALYETLGHENFAALADSRAVRCGPVLRALEALKGKTVSLFLTHGGGGMQSLGRDFAAVVGEDAKILPPKAFAGSSVKSSVTALETFVTDRVTTK